MTGLRNITNFLTTLVLALLLLAPLSWGESETPSENTPQTDPANAPEEHAVNTGSTNSTDNSPNTTAKRSLGYSIPRSQYPLNTEHYMQILAKDLNDEEAIAWIEEDNTPPFLALWHSDRTGNAKGAILIIHAEGEHPAWPQTTLPLHDSLPDHGWATMAIHLPDPTPKAISERTLAVKTSHTNTENPEQNPKNSTKETTGENTINTTKEAESTSTKNKPESASYRRLEAALEFLHSKGQYNIIIMGSGVGAIRTHRFIKEITPVITDPRLKAKFEKPIRASVIFNARNQLPNEKSIYKEWFADPEIPVLDIYTAEDIRNTNAAKKRKIFGKRANAMNHSQIKIAEITYETVWGENQLSRRIRSFLDANFKGIEINKK